jgi:hypothetical protein
MAQFRVKKAKRKITVQNSKVPCFLDMPKLAT